MPNTPSPNANAPAWPRDAAAMAQPATLRDVLTSIFYHGRVIALVLALALGAGVLATMLMRPTYRAQARLLALDSAAYGAPLAAGKTYSQEQSMAPFRIADLEMQMLGSHEIASDVAQMNLPGDATATQLAAEAQRIAQHTHIGRPIDSPVIEVTYSDATPEAARETLEHILAAHSARRGAALTAGRFDYIFRQRRLLEQQLGAVDARILAYEHDHHVENSDAARATAIAAAFAVDMQRNQIASRIAADRAAIARLRMASQASPGGTILVRDNGTAVGSLSHLWASQTHQIARRAALASRYLAGSPAIQAADAALAETDATITGAMPQLPSSQMSGPDPVAEASANKLVLAEAQAAGDAARRDALARQSAQVHRQIDQLIVQASPLARMQQERQVLQQTYAGLSQQLEEARHFENPDPAGNANLRILCPPQLIGRSNSAAMVLAASLFAGALVALNVVLVLASLRNSFLIPAEVERALGMRVLFAPFARNNAQKPEPVSLHRLLAAMHQATPITGGVVIAIATPDEFGPAQAFSTLLLQALERRATGRAIRIRLDNTAALPAAIPPAGNTDIAVHPLEAAAGTLMDQLIQRFGTVLLVAPEASIASAIPVMAHKANMVVLVLTAGVSSRSQAAELERRLSGHGARTMAAVLLDRHHYIPQALYRLLFDHGGWPMNTWLSTTGCAIKAMIKAAGNRRATPDRVAEPI